jgi:hypothetical protein
MVEGELERKFIERGYLPYDSDRGFVTSNEFGGELIKKIIFAYNQMNTGKIKDFAVIPEREFSNNPNSINGYRLLIKRS